MYCKSKFLSSFSVGGYVMKQSVLHFVSIKVLTLICLALLFSLVTSSSLLAQFNIRCPQAPERTFDGFPLFRMDEGEEIIIGVEASEGANFTTSFDDTVISVTPNKADDTLSQDFLVSALKEGSTRLTIRAVDADAVGPQGTRPEGFCVFQVMVEKAVSSTPSPSPTATSTPIDTSELLDGIIDGVDSALSLEVEAEGLAEGEEFEESVKRLLEAIEALEEVRSLINNQLEMDVIGGLEAFILGGPIRQAIRADERIIILLSGEGSLPVSGRLAQRLLPALFTSANGFKNNAIESANELLQ